MLPAQPGAGQGQEAGTWRLEAAPPCIIFSVPLQCCHLPCHLSWITRSTAHWSYIITTNNYLGTFHFDTHLKQIKTFKPISSRVWV